MRPARKGPEKGFAVGARRGADRASMRPARKGPEKVRRMEAPLSVRRELQ